MAKSNFLDDKLYAYFEDTKDSIEISPEGLADWLNGFYDICNAHKAQYPPELIIPTLDRIFKAWDRFIDRIPKEDTILKEMLMELSYRNELLQDPEIAVAYHILKNDNHERAR